jgi:hypothetical protein
MKKIFILPLFAAAVFVGLAWAQLDFTPIEVPDPWADSGGNNCHHPTHGQLFCQYAGAGGTTDCHTVNNAYTPNIGIPCLTLVQGCLQDGMLYRGVPESALTAANNYGKGVNCGTAGGTYMGGNDPNRTSLGCCKWDSGTQCWDIWSDNHDDGTTPQQKVEDCKGGDNQFWAGACPDGQGTCPGGTNSIATPSSTAANLNVLVQTGSLHISSVREATVQLFDVSGKQMLSEKVPSGYSVVNLKDQKVGVYFAVITSGSHKQTVKVTLK